jgi:hypothetical protein
MRIQQTRRASPVAHAALQTLAGWQPTHRSLEAEAAELLDVEERDNAARQTFARIVRNVMGAVLLLAGVATATTSYADPIPAVPADCSVCGHAVSAEMQARISEFVHTSIRRDALEASEDNEKLGLVIQERHRALSALAFHAPVNLLELAAKLIVVTEYAEDTERWANRAAAQDAARLAGEGAR